MKLYTHIHTISWKSARVVVGADDAPYSGSACEAVVLDITRQGVTVLVFFYASVMRGRIPHASFAHCFERRAVA